MKQLIFSIVFFAVMTSGKAQGNIEILPHVYLGTGINQMKDITVHPGFGWDIGYDFEGSSFGASAFYNFSRYSMRSEQLPMFNHEDGLNEKVDVDNKSRVSTYGLKMRYSPLVLQGRRFVPYAELGVGLATHSTVWNSQGELYDITYDYSDPDCPKTTYHYGHEETERIHRNTTFIGTGEIGFRVRIAPDHRTTRNGWYLGASARVELGGQVEYRNANQSPHHFYYESGLSSEENTPFSSEAPMNDRGTSSFANHQMLVFQISLTKVLF
jgi:hypothetical protein